jgi:hypothetical protein
VNLDLGAIAIWGTAFVSGAWVAIGVTSAVSGRLIVNPRRVAWSRREVEMLAANTVVQGLALSIYSLAGGLFLSSTGKPFWVGHAWGMLVGAPLVLFMMATIGFQTYVEHRHFERLERSAGQETAG